MRLDLYLKEHGLAKSRTQAAEWIADGRVCVGGIPVTKPAYPIEGTEAYTVTVAPPDTVYVSRGAWKLQHALDTWHIDVTGWRVLDIGASTGGFTDCLLRRGAAHVYALDSGTGQLDSSLRSDVRVTNLENRNARYMQPSDFGDPCDMAVSDVSFISQTLILPAVSQVVKKGGLYIGLVKPQFECGREALHKNGIVRDKKYRFTALTRVYDCMCENHMTPLYAATSPITGGDGNVEFLLGAVCGEGNALPLEREKLRETAYGDEK